MIRIAKRASKVVIEMTDTPYGYPLTLAEIPMTLRRLRARRHLIRERHPLVHAATRRWPALFWVPSILAQAVPPLWRFFLIWGRRS